MRTVPALLLLAMLSFGAWAQPTETASEEIEHLLAYLGGSHCEFARNGTWHSGGKAAEHLREKYEYLLKKGRVITAETFIDLVASRSSVSGDPYLVRCGNDPADATGPWFRAELERFRAEKRLTPKQSLEGGLPLVAT